MINKKEIKEKIEIAEDCVSAVEDNNLKQIAFKIVLSNLLHVEDVIVPDMDKKTKKKPKVSKNRKPVKISKETKESEIELNTEQLKELKEYYENKAPKGNEESVFILACFIDEKIQKKDFLGIDIYKIYVNLLSLKPTLRPPQLTQEQINQSLRNLVANSRHKLWLSRNDSGSYEISTQGRYHLNYEPKSSRD